MVEISAAISALANILIACATITAAIVAATGLNTWKNRYVWEADTDLAKRSLLAIYRFRDSLYSVRHPAMFHHEMEVSTAEAEGINASNERSAGVINAYANRWEKHSKSRVELDALITEADVLWSSELRQLVEPLRVLENELFGHIRLYLDAWHRGKTDLAKEYQTILSERRDILYDRLDDEKDCFRADCISELLKVEDYLRSKLGRKL
ncbi:MAG: hypothetical protein HRU33_01480 [Rhodobacteraceae bacterium]|nr:hypothetical protein [Paracoccaceae bacterium]